MARSFSGSWKQSINILRPNLTDSLSLPACTFKYCFSYVRYHNKWCVFMQFYFTDGSFSFSAHLPNKQLKYICVMEVIVKKAKATHLYRLGTNSLRKIVKRHSTWRSIISSKYLEELNSLSLKAYKLFIVTNIQNILLRYSHYYAHLFCISKSIAILYDIESIKNPKILLIFKILWLSG